MNNSEIVKFYKNQTVFITGGTGFLGKVLIEKLLRVCEPKKINVLLRTKKEKSLDERSENFFNFPCFDRLKNEFKDFKSKICFIGGDCKAPNLGISEEDQQNLINETTIVIHAAANVKFDQTLRVATNTNVRSTVEVLGLAKKMPLLKAFVYVSTAYSNCIHKEIKEEFYSPPMSYQALFTLVENTDDETLEKITPILVGKWPNPYNYSKCVSENVVKTLGKDLPIAVVRPAIICNAIEEPVAGWIDNFYAAVGISVGVAIGIIRTYRGRNECIAQLVPIDYVSNVVLTAAWNTQNQKNSVIYNFTGCKNNLITWGQFQQYTKKCVYLIPPEKKIWKMCFKLRENKLWNDVCVFFLHTIPAYLIDGILFCIGKPTVAVKGYKKLNHSLNLISYFTLRNWFFEDNNLMKMWNSMTEEDQKLFNFNMENFCWPEYLRIGTFGCIKYLLKTTPNENPKLTKKTIVLFIAHYTVIILFWYLIFKFASFIVNWFL